MPAYHDTVILDPWTHTQGLGYTYVCPKILADGSCWVWTHKNGDISADAVRGGAFDVLDGDARRQRSAEIRPDSFTQTPSNPL